jgi:magnesium chelatase family protein
MLSTLTSAALVGIDAVPVQVEVNANESGEPRLILIGLPDAAVKESADRVFSALSQCGFAALRTRTTVNLAPGGLRKEGALYDLPIALALLAASGQIQMNAHEEFLVAGELSLSGSTRPIRGALAIARLAKKLGRRTLLLPGISAEEAALVAGVSVHRIDTLVDACRLLCGEKAPPPVAPQPFPISDPPTGGPDFSEIKGQRTLRRAIEVACSGSHNLLIIGPPGSGKSMAAKRIPTVMPPPTPDERLAILTVHSVAGRTLRGAAPAALARPFRSPHHTVSDVALIGGGAIPAPGEISLAHHGVLFLDELPEFRRSALEVLRQPLEDGEVTVSRSAGKVVFPAEFMLVAAMNPCPCGHLGDPRRRCKCTPSQIETYRARISGPLLDRIDIHTEAPAITFAELRSNEPGESSAAIRERVLRARERQRRRLTPSSTTANARMNHAQLRKHCAIDPALGDLLQQAMEKLSLSARAYHRILKVARTVADLAGAENIDAPHLLEAIQYRTLDRNSSP